MNSLNKQSIPKGSAITGVRALLGQSKYGRENCDSKQAYKGFSQETGNSKECYAEWKTPSERGTLHVLSQNKLIHCESVWSLHEYCPLIYT